MNRNRARKKISRQIFYFFTYLAKKIFFYTAKKLPADNSKYKAHNQKYV